MVPFLLVYGPKDRRTDILSCVELKRSRRNKKVYLNVYDNDYQAFRYDMDADEIVSYREWAIPAILEREMQWGNLEEFHEELEKGWYKNKGLMPGITLFPPMLKNLGNGRSTSTSAYFTFDPKIITVEQTNLFLKPIGGSIRLY